jgi:D-galactarolactone cycloisomerase
MKTPLRSIAVRDGKVTRRRFLQAAAAHAAVLAPVNKLAAAVKPVRITAVDVFPIVIPVSKEDEQAGKTNRFLVSRVTTDAGVRGYSFTGPNPALLDSRIRPALVGKDLFAIERHLSTGLLEWDGLEHAVWDAIGRIAGQPVYRLLGGSKDRLRLYLTTVWQGKADQSDVSYEQQAQMAARIRKAGFHGMKIRAWRPNPLDDAAAMQEIRAATGPDFHVMFDRTAHAPESVGQKVWDYETGRKTALALQEAGAYWLEEPFARNDYASHARLRREVDILITGGEGYLGLRPFHEALMANAYDIVQPEGARSGGIFLCRKVAILAESFHVPTILHGTMSLRLAGWLQASAAIGAPWQEVVFIRPPLLPEDLWSPGLRVLRTKTMYTIENGEILVPDLPGIGLDVDEEAVNRFRASGTR